MINRKEHINLEGLQKIVNIKASLNLGLSNELKAVFTDTVSVKRSVIINKKILDPYWFADFIGGEGCITINIYKKF